MAGGVEVWDFLKKCTKVAYGRKGKVFGEKWVNLCRAKAKVGFVRM